ncbi:hypothetical protein SCANM124S_03807 [Streptomyces canus]
MAIRPLYYPLGADKATGMTEQERTVVRDILADCQDVVAWGGDLDPVKESKRNPRPRRRKHRRVRAGPHPPRQGGHSGLTRGARS